MNTLEECIKEEGAARERFVDASALVNCALVLGASAEVISMLRAEASKRWDEEAEVVGRRADGIQGTMIRFKYPKPPEKLVKVLVGMGGADRATITLETKDSETGEYVSFQSFTAEKPQAGLADFAPAVKGRDVP